jgi:UDP-2,4-diacetamido-2,4,6-trideoxy-beta-L-altropyranose hydrolase
VVRIDHIANRETVRVAIRVDASPQSGTGHVMRCLALADGLRARGAYTRFICRELPDSMRTRLEQSGHAIHMLQPCGPVESQAEGGHAAWLSAGWERDSTEVMHVLSQDRWDWLIIDHYGIDARWEGVCATAARSMLVIDDLADRKHYCDVLVDQNNLAERNNPYRALVPRATRCLLGPRYALLRSEFRALRECVRSRGEIKRVLIFFGGTDPYNLTTRAITALSDEFAFDIEVVIGGLNPYRAEIKATCAASPNVGLHIDTLQMADLMSRADLAIGAAGTTSWERACLGLPSIVVSFARNQEELARSLADANIAVYLENLDASMEEQLRQIVRRLSRDARQVAGMSERAMRLVDGLGTKRVCSVLLATRGIRLRVATMADAELAWAWRSAESTRRHFFDPSWVPLPDHLSWWERTLASDRSILLIGVCAADDIGVVRLDLCESSGARVSIYLDPDMTGVGLGSSLIQALISWVIAMKPSLEWLDALIKPENHASQSVFAAAGFREIGERFVWQRTRGNLQ